jgi:hypothetical protein
MSLASTFWYCKLLIRSAAFPRILMLKQIFTVFLYVISSFAIANQAITIQGDKLEYQIKGSGEITVLFDAGALTGMAGWDALWDALPQDIKAIRFSRLGEGNSDACTGQRTNQQHVEEVEAILNALNVKKPFLYVGHSLGGATARNYTSTYSDSVLGLLLVDPENPRDVDIIKELDPVKGPIEIEQIKANDYKLSEGKWCFLDAIWNKEKAMDFDDIGDIPVTLIATVMQYENPKTIFNSDAGRKRWGEIQQDWVKTFPQGKFVATDKSPHYIQESEPELVLHELSLLLTQVRQSLFLSDISGKWQHASKPAVIQFNINTRDAIVFQHQHAASAGLNLLKNISASEDSEKQWKGEMFNGYQDKYVEVLINLDKHNSLSISTLDGKEVLLLER